MLRSFFSILVKWVGSFSRSLSLMQSLLFLQKRQMNYVIDQIPDKYPGVRIWVSSYSNCFVFVRKNFASNFIIVKNQEYKNLFPLFKFPQSYFKRWKLYCEKNNTKIFLVKTFSLMPNLTFYALVIKFWSINQTGSTKSKF